MIADDVKSLLRDCIESFEQLGILLRLRTGGDSWTANAIEEQLNVPSELAAQALDQLCRCDLLAVRIEGKSRFYRYSPGTPGLDAAVKGLAEAYEEERLEVMQLMNANAIERVRTSAMRAFADAFLLSGGGKKKDG